MVAQLLRLRLRLLLNSRRRPLGQLVARGFAVLLGLLAVIWGIRVLTTAVGAAETEAVRNSFVVVAAIVSISFFLVPLLFSKEDSLDPRRLALFGLPDRELAFGTVVAGLVSVPVFGLVIAAGSSAIVWASGSDAGFGAFLIGILSFVLGVALCVVLARIAAGLAALLLENQRARSLGGSLAILLIVIAAPVIVLLATQDWKNDAGAVLAQLAGIAAWTPFGAPWAAMADAARGEWLAAVLSLVVSIVLLGVAWLLWRLLVARMLLSPGRTESQRGARGLGWFDRLPRGPMGAIAGRSFTYWTRDPRYWVSVAIIPIAPILVIIPLLVAGVPGSALVLLPVPFMCLLIGWAIHNDVAYDGSAVWLHVASGVKGISDRVGRLIPIALGGIVVIGIGSAIAVALYGDWGVLPSALGVSTALLLCGLGCASYTSARFPYAVTKPGDGAFTQPQSTAGDSVTVQALSLLCTLLLASPAIIFAVLGFTSDPGWHLAALASGVGIGALVLVVGVWWGGVTFDRRGPELLAAALRS